MYYSTIICLCEHQLGELTDKVELRVNFLLFWIPSHFCIHELHKMAKVTTLIRNGIKTKLLKCLACFWKITICRGMLPLLLSTSLIFLYRKMIFSSPEKIRINHFNAFNHSLLPEKENGTGIGEYKNSLSLFPVIQFISVLFCFFFRLGKVIRLKPHFRQKSLFWFSIMFSNTVIQIVISTSIWTIYSKKCIQKYAEGTHRYSVR